MQQKYVFGYAKILNVIDWLVRLQIYIFVLIGCLSPVLNRAGVGDTNAKNYLFLILLSLSSITLIIAISIRRTPSVPIVFVSIPILSLLSGYISSTDFSLFRIAIWVLFVLAIATASDSLDFTIEAFRLSLVLVFTSLALVFFPNSLGFYSSSRFTFGFFDLRLAGFTSYANSLGVFAGYLTIYSFVYGIKQRFLFLCIAMLTLVLTETRSVILFLLFLFLVQTLKKILGRSRMQLGISVAFAALLSFIFIRGYWIYLFTNQDDLLTLSTRTAIWQVPLKVWSESKLIGVGYAWYDRAYEAVTQLGVVNAHNSWITLLASTGIVGVVFLVLTLSSLIKSGIAMRDYGGLLLMAYLLFISITEPVIEFIFSSESSILFILVCFEMFKKRENKRRRRE